MSTQTARKTMSFFRNSESAVFLFDSRKCGGSGFYKLEMSSRQNTFIFPDSALPGFYKLEMSSRQNTRDQIQRAVSEFYKLEMNSR